MQCRKERKQVVWKGCPLLSFFFFSFSFFFSCVFLWFFLSEKNCAPRVLSVYNLYLIPFPSFLHSDSFFNSSSYLVSFFLQFINSSSFFCFFFCSEMRRHGWELPYHPLQACFLSFILLILSLAFFLISLSYSFMFLSLDILLPFFCVRRWSPSLSSWPSASRSLFSSFLSWEAMSWRSS